MLAHQAGQSEIAIELINHAIQASPANHLFHNNLGTVFLENHRPDEAAVCFKKAISLKQNYVEAHYNLGNALNDKEKLDEAITCFQKAIALKPDYAEAHNNLGTLFNKQGKPEKATTCFQKALILDPNYAEAHNNMGVALKNQGLLTEAAAHFQKASLLKPDYTEAYNNLGVLLCSQDKPHEAVNCFQRAIAINPDFAEAHSNLGSAFRSLNQWSMAVPCHQRAIALKPNFAVAHHNLGNALCAVGRLSEGIARYRTALEIKPDYEDAHSTLIFNMDLMVDFDIPVLQQERKCWAEIHAASLVEKQRPHTNIPDLEHRLRIGYVSADFRQHSAATAFGAMLVKFDQTLFEIIAYSNSTKEDHYTQLFRQNVTLWRNIVGLSDDAVADMIRDDGIDILVDLSGHTAGNRLLVFARKPAPIQVSAWGYPTGTGMKALDVLFSDPVIVPPEEKLFYAEQVYYLPNVVGFFSLEAFPAVGTLPALSAEGITFGSLNRLTKVSRETFDLWARVLAAVPGSRLMLKSAEFDDAGTRAQVSMYFTEAGIAPERLVMLGKTPWQEHMSAFNQIDIALDPFPQGGGVTTLEGLMMGVPIVTLRWPTLAGRVSTSILTTLDLTDWIAETQEQYLGIAIQKAQDLEALANLRQDLRNRCTASPIGYAALYVKAVESAYRQLWQDWCKRHSNSSSMTAIP
ncbi:MAG: tetratricopeptide repeat protein [Sulfuricella sp.]